MLFTTVSLPILMTSLCDLCGTSHCLSHSTAEGMNDAQRLIESLMNVNAHWGIAAHYLLAMDSDELPSHS